VIVVLDASTLINLANGDALAIVLSIPGAKFLVSSAVRSESKSIASAVDAAVAAGSLGLVDDSLISARAFRAARQELRLGAGETECILAAVGLGCAMACDDGAARSAAIRLLGQDQVIGSIGLLRMARAAGLLTAGQAFVAYELMQARGGYLPQLRPADF